DADAFRGEFDGSGHGEAVDRAFRGRVPAHTSHAHPREARAHVDDRTAVTAEFGQEALGEHDRRDSVELEGLAQRFPLELPQVRAMAPADVIDQSGKRSAALEVFAHARDRARIGVVDGEVFHLPARGRGPARDDDLVSALRKPARDREADPGGPAGHERHTHLATHLSTVPSHGPESSNTTSPPTSVASTLVWFGSWSSGLASSTAKSAR